MDIVGCSDTCLVSSVATRRVRCTSLTSTDERVHVLSQYHGFGDATHWLRREFGRRNSDLEAAESTLTSMLIASARDSGSLFSEGRAIDPHAADRDVCRVSRSCMACPALRSRGFLITSGRFFVHLDILARSM